jgi:uncharacterized membrane protein YidH (DUF202 family)
MPIAKMGTTLMGYVAGAVLVILGLLIIVLGDRKVGEKGDAITRAFSMPTLHVKFVKWGAGILCIWFGAALLFGGGHL